MIVKWNKAAIQQFLDAIQYIEDHGFYNYADELGKNILFKIRNISENPDLYPMDRYKKDNDGSYHAFEIDSFRISYRNKNGVIRIMRIRHTSRRIRKY